MRLLKRFNRKLTTSFCVQSYLACVKMCLRSKFQRRNFLITRCAQRWLLFVVLVLIVCISPPVHVEQWKAFKYVKPLKGDERRKIKSYIHETRRPPWRKKGGRSRTCKFTVDENTYDGSFPSVPTYLVDIARETSEFTSLDMHLNWHSYVIICEWLYVTHEMTYFTYDKNKQAVVFL
jgi:hypothetical protein